MTPSTGRRDICRQHQNTPELNGFFIRISISPHVSHLPLHRQNFVCDVTPGASTRRSSALPVSPRRSVSLWGCRQGAAEPAAGFITWTAELRGFFFILILTISSDLLSFRTTLPPAPCLGLQMMWASSLKVHTGWVILVIYGEKLVVGLWRGIWSLTLN